jgi:hypothetical protein
MKNIVLLVAVAGLAAACQQPPAKRSIVIDFQAPAEAAAAAPAAGAGGKP